jgi:Zn-finger protein
MQGCEYAACTQGRKCLYSYSPSSMASTSERKKQVKSFADVADRSDILQSDVQGYNQLGFEGLDTGENKEVTIENLEITKLPQVKKVDGRIAWSCGVSYQRDLWHQEDYSELVLHALHNASAAIALRLKLRDVVQVTGIMWDQKIDLRGGKTKTIHHLNVTDMVIMKRAPAQTARRT